MSDKVKADEAIAQIVESATELGVEVDAEEAIQWLAAMANVQGNDIVMDVSHGVFGHTITMLDFSPTQLKRYRHFADIVQLEDQPKIETAIALSGSAAQSKIQSFPGDLDYFEQVNIIAESHADACELLGDLLRQKALHTMRGPDYRLIEVKFGSYPRTVVRDGQHFSQGAPISWSPTDIEAGYIEAEEIDGRPALLHWDVVRNDPGWCKLDWIVTDAERGRLANASNMLDVTWEAPSGEIYPLDGHLDPYFQEVYLEADAIPLFSKLAKNVSTDALDNYVRQLEGEVTKYLKPDQLNYGKAAKRMYNIFRLTGRYSEAAYIRELFDEPATILYQVWSLIRTLDDVSSVGSRLPMDKVQQQADQLILSVVRSIEGEDEVTIVRHLLTLKDALRDEEGGHGLSATAETARAEVIRVVNDFFQERLALIPTIEAYLSQRMA